MLHDRWVGAGRAVPPLTGDRELALELARLAGHRCRRVAAATVHLDAAVPVRMAFIRADARTVFEVGSVTKALTGMLLADAIERTELTMTSTVGQLVPSLAGSAVATVTVQELCTHTSGLPRLPTNPRTVVRVAQFALLGLDPYRGITASQVVAVTGRQNLRHRGRRNYSESRCGTAGPASGRACRRRLWRLAATADFHAGRHAPRWRRDHSAEGRARLVGRWPASATMGHGRLRSGRRCNRHHRRPGQARSRATGPDGARMPVDGGNPWRSVHEAGSTKRNVLDH